LGDKLEPYSIIENLNPKKDSFRTSKWPWKLKTAKNSKLPKFPENCFETVGKGGWMSISTSIIFTTESDKYPWLLHHTKSHLYNLLS
jgi:hypothetical protein